MSDGCPRCKSALPEPAPGSPSLELCPYCGSSLLATQSDGTATQISPSQDRGEHVEAGEPPTVQASNPSRPSSRHDSLSHHGRFQPGERVGDRYRIVALLGKGGMGEVYRADDLELGISVALKLLPEELTHDQESLDRLRAEVRTARQVAHPNVCRIYDLGQADGHVFLTMEYVDGEDLVTTLRRLGRPTQEKALEIARQLCAGLAATHEQGVLHGDLKPANIMIDGRGRLRIADFGLARTADAAHAEGGIVGTPAYMAPEQLEGKPADVRSDIFALGLVLYELFTGRRPYEASQLQELRAQHSSGSITTPGRFVTGLNPAIERVILQCLESDPDDRPASVFAVMAGLPGADPLAAALAAGDTPSPEMVANAGASRGMRPLRALGLVGLMILLMVPFGTIRTVQVQWPATPPETLAVLAELMLGRLGYEEPRAYEVQGFEPNRRQLGTLAREDAGPGRWASLGGRTPGWYFWKRWSPAPLRSTRFHSPIVWLENPPPIDAGSISLALDDEGHLLSLTVIPNPEAQESAPDPVDWNLVFELTGFDPAEFFETHADRAPPVQHDEARAWTSLDDTGPHVWHLRAASYRNRIVHVALDTSWGPAVPTHPLETVQASTYRGIYGPLLSSVVAVLFLIAGGAAWRNVAAGRGDRRGAVRLFVLILVVNLGETILGTELRQVGLSSVLMDLTLGPMIAHGLLHGAQVALLYLAIEPYARKIWPHSLVSWMRLLKGRIRDPLVGRDVLVGGPCAAVGALGFGIFVWALPHLGLPGPPPVLSENSMVALRGLKHAFSLYLFVISNALIYCFGEVVLLLLAKHLLRKTWLAVPFVAFAPLLFLVSQNYYLSPAVLLIFSLWYGLVAAVAFLRFGLLAMFITNYVFFLSFLFIPNLNPGAWYGYLFFLCTGMGITIAVLAVRAATYGQKWFPQEM